MFSDNVKRTFLILVHKIKNILEIIEKNQGSFISVILKMNVVWTNIFYRKIKMFFIIISEMSY